MAARCGMAVADTGSSDVPGPPSTRMPNQPIRVSLSSCPAARLNSSVQGSSKKRLDDLKAWAPPYKHDTNGAQILTPHTQACHNLISQRCPPYLGFRRRRCAIVISEVLSLEHRFGRKVLDRPDGKLGFVGHVQQVIDPAPLVASQAPYARGPACRKHFLLKPGLASTPARRIYAQPCTVEVRFNAQEYLAPIIARMHENKLSKHRESHVTM